MDSLAGRSVSFSQASFHPGFGAREAEAGAEVPQEVTVFSYCQQLCAVGYFLFFSFLYSLQFFFLKLGEKVGIGKRLGKEGEALRFRKYLGGAYRVFLGEMCRKELLCLREEGVGSLEGEGGLVIAANHPGFFDAIIVSAFLPEVVCVMRAGLLKNPLFSGAALRSGFIPNDSGADFVRSSVAKLKGGENVLIFPEGTRTGEGRFVNSLKGGFALIAIKAKVPVQTLLVEMEGNMFRKGVPLWWPARLPVKIRVRVGERFFVGEGESAHQLTGRVQAYFESALAGTGGEK